MALPAVSLAVGWSATASMALPLPEELVPNTVARISELSHKTGTITRAEFRHALVLEAAAKGRRTAPEPGGRGYERLMRAALDTRLETAWVKGQAAEMSIVVTRRQVSRRLTLLKKQAFEGAAQYRRFLRESRLTRRDVYERVELELLAMRIQDRVQAGARSEAEEQEAFEVFLAEYNQRWRGRTVCAPQYVTELCSNRPQ